MNDCPEIDSVISVRRSASSRSIGINVRNILVIDDQLSVENSDLKGAFEHVVKESELPFNYYFTTGLNNKTASYDAEAAKQKLRETIISHHIDGILLDLGFGSKPYLGLAILEGLTNDFPDIPVIMLTAVNRDAVETIHGKRTTIWRHCVNRGAVDYLPKIMLFDPINKVLIKRMLDRYIGENLAIEHWLIGQSSSFNIALNNIAEVAEQGTSNVLIVCEPGTEDEALGRYFHRHGCRATQKFTSVPIIREQEYEAEWFGAVPGAHGYPDGKVGLFQGANEEGVFFVPEATKIPKSKQHVLAYPMRYKEYAMVGNAKEKIRIDVQFVCATQKDILNEEKDGNFHTVLLAELGRQVSMPSLDERREDIPLLLRHLFRFFVTEKSPERWKMPEIPESVEEQLQLASWPNIASLKDYVQLVLDKASDGEVRNEHFESAWGDFEAAFPPKFSPQPKVTLENLHNVITSIFIGDEDIELKDVLQELYLAELAIHYEALLDLNSGQRNLNRKDASKKVLLPNRVNHGNSFKDQVWDIYSRLTPQNQLVARSKFQEMEDEFEGRKKQSKK